MSLVKKIREKLLLWRLRRDEYESAELRNYFRATYDIEIGAYSYGCFDRWRIPPGTRIGRYCSFANSVRILDANHPINALSTHPYFYETRFSIIETDPLIKTHLIVEDGVWLSHNATITPSCSKIGRGAIVGAGAVVTKDIPPYAIVTGVPAKIQRYRFNPTTIAAIEESKWWELDKAALHIFVKKHPEFVMKPGE